MSPTAAKCCPFCHFDPDLILPVDDIPVAHKEGGFPASLGKIEIIPLSTLANLFDTAEADTIALLKELAYPKSIVDKHRHTRMATISSSAMANPTANPVSRPVSHLHIPMNSHIQTEIPLLMKSFENVNSSCK